VREGNPTGMSRSASAGGTPPTRSGRSAARSRLGGTRRHMNSCTFPFTWLWTRWSRQTQCALLLAQRLERRPDLGREQLGLFPGGEVAAPVHLVEIDEIVVGLLHPVARGLEDLDPCSISWRAFALPEPATSNPRGLRCSRTLMPSGAAITVTAIATARTRQGWRLTRARICCRGIMSRRHEGLTNCAQAPGPP
jgi:hypothetical protein